TPARRRCPPARERASPSAAANVPTAHRKRCDLERLTGRTARRVSGHGACVPVGAGGETMRTRVLAACFAAAALLLAAAAQAGTLTSATWLQVTQGVPMTRTTAQLGASGSSPAGSIAVSLSYPAFSGNFLIPTAPPWSFPLAVKITQGGAQAITATPGMGGGTPGIPGTVIVMDSLHVAMGVNQSMFN